jgi:putative transposase
MKKNTINGAIGATFKTPQGEKLLIERELGDGLLHVITVPGGSVYRVEDPVTGELMLPDTHWLERGLADSSLRLYADDRGVIAPERKLAKVFDRELILKLDPYAKARLAVMLALLERGVDSTDPKLGSEIKKAWSRELQEEFGDRPETATVREWFGRCRGATVELCDMLSMSGRGPRANRLDPAVEAVIDAARSRFWTNRGYKRIDVQAEVVSELVKENLLRSAAGEPLLQIPGKETIRRRVNEMLCRDTYAAKYGEPAARRKFDGSGNGITAYRILQIALMDDTVVDLVTVLDVDRGLVAGRPYLNVLMDVHSRCILALTVSFQPPSVDKAAECIRVAMNCLREGNRPKIGLRPDWVERYPALPTVNGKPAKIITDNGFNYVAAGFTEMMLDLGIVHELAPVKAPRHKAMIERFFRSFNTFLIDKLPGATLDPSLLRKLGIDPATEAIVTMAELRELIAQFLYIYHITHHSGIDAVPLRKWSSSMAVHGRDMILDSRLIDIVTGVTMHDKRITAGGGVRMFGMVWKGAELDAVIRKLAAKEPAGKQLEATAAVTTKIKYNPENLLHIQVFVGVDWLELENTQIDYAANLTLWHHKQIRAWAKAESLAFTSEKDRLKARHELNLTVREAFPDMDRRERRAMARLMGPGTEGKPMFDVEFAEAVPRHDGLGPIIEHEVPANERDDAQRPVSRPNRNGGAAKAKNNKADDEWENGDNPGDDAPVLDPSTPIVEPADPDDDDLNDEEYR